MAYKHGEHVVSIHVPLTIAQFRNIEKIMGAPPGPHKDWTDHYVFTVPSGKSPFGLLNYLQIIEVPHRVESVRTWAPTTPKPQLQKASS
jgi:hypothetical protein